MFGIIAVLIVLIFLIIFYKWCGSRTSLFYKVLLFIGAIPFIDHLIILIISAKSGFILSDFTPVYGLKAFITGFILYCFFYFYIFIPAGIAVIVAIINLIKLKRGNKNE